MIKNVERTGKPFIAILVSMHPPVIDRTPNNFLDGVGIAADASAHAEGLLTTTILLHADSICQPERRQKKRFWERYM